MYLQGGSLLRFSSIFENYTSLLCNRLFKSYVHHSTVVQSESSKNKINQVYIPEKPKKPPTPFFKFLAEQRQLLIRDNPNLKTTEITKQCAEKWRSLDTTAKEKYNATFKEELQQYLKSVTLYNDSLSIQQKEAIDLSSAKKKSDRKRRSLRKRLKEANKPKRPMGVFMDFLLEEAKAKNCTPLSIAKDVKDKWHSMSPEEKTKYNLAYEKRKLKYDKELMEWENKMIQEGHTDLVRVSRIPKKKGKTE